MISNPWVWISIIGIVVLLGVEWILLEKLPKTAAAKSLATTLDRNKYVALTAAVVGLSAGVTTVLLLIPLIILPLIVVPPIVGTYGANRALERDLVIYDKGCDHPINPKNYCHVIMDGSRIVANGFLVAASNTRVAMYDNGKAKIIPIKNYSIETLPPKDYLALVAAGKIEGASSSKVGQP